MEDVEWGGRVGRGGGGKRKWHSMSNILTRNDKVLKDAQLDQICTLIVNDIAKNPLFCFVIAAVGESGGSGGGGGKRKWHSMSNILTRNDSVLKDAQLNHICMPMVDDIAKNPLFFFFSFLLLLFLFSYNSS